MSISLDQIIPIVEAAGKYVLGSLETASTDKTNSKDFVTVADIKAQDFLRAELHKLYPKTLVISEEDSEEQKKEIYKDDFTGFVIDPIDGTYNFKRDMRESAVSVGYIYKGQPQLGAIYDPYKDELFSATKGQGAFKNGEPIRVSAQDTLVGSSVATSNSYDDAAMTRNLKRHLGIYKVTGSMPWTSCPGSGVLILAYVACGRIDAYHHNGIKPWDCAAAHLLVREAGGEVFTLQGEQAKFTEPTLLAGNSKIIKEMQKIFQQLPPDLLS